MIDMVVWIEASAAELESATSNDGEIVRGWAPDVELLAWAGLTRQKGEAV